MGVGLWETACRGMRRTWRQKRWPLGTAIGAERHIPARAATWGTGLPPSRSFCLPFVCDLPRTLYEQIPHVPEEIPDFYIEFDPVPQPVGADRERRHGHGSAVWFIRLRGCGGDADRRGRPRAAKRPFANGLTSRGTDELWPNDGASGRGCRRPCGHRLDGLPWVPRRPRGKSPRGRRQG